MEALLALIGVLALIPILVLYSSFAWGYVASIIYRWFILIIFPTAPHLTWIQLAGIMFLVNCFVHDSTITVLKDEIKDKKAMWINTLIRPWAVLLAASLFKTIFFN